MAQFLVWLGLRLMALVVLVTAGGAAIKVWDLGYPWVALVLVGAVVAGLLVFIGIELEERGYR